ncbi:hypothetical protein SCUCBS95973_007443 [Sporothrix curviconia]|uniref:Cyclase n=1 Tax=Sporothrix curviconia TaxID=1260050 RepID=A0ABP0CDB6_9PEZI
MATFADLPTFDELKDKQKYWPAKAGSHEEGLGMLRYLTPAHVAKVVQHEVKTGERVCLNWDMTRLETPGFNRFPCQHKIVPIPNYEGVAWDDIWRFKPQASSQWDGFRHYSAMQPDGKRRDRIGVGHWAQKGIATRGFLIDYVSYVEKKGGVANGMNGTAVTLEEVLEIAKECNIEFQPGDIFFLRVGFTKTWEALTLDKKKEYREATKAHKHGHSGLIQSEAVTRFLCDNHVVAVAGDGVSFEVRPNKDNDWSLHHYLLAGWGVPIGEMFDLERLAELCKQQNRWTFFVTSSPLNHPRAVASPPACMAIF